MKRLKILMVGLGSIGQRHVRNLRRLLGDALELGAFRVCGSGQILTDELDVAAPSGLEQRYGIRRFDSLEAALADAPDAVFVTNPSAMHLDVAWEAIRRGCHVFVEKPLATSADRLDALVELAQASGRVAQVGYQLRFHPGFARMEALLREGRPGRILGVRAVVGEPLATAHPYEDYRRSYAARADLGGGVLLGLSHEFDFLHAWFGMPRRVFAMGGKLSRLELDVEDTASVLMEMERAGECFPVHVHLDYAQRPPIRSCAVMGDEGRIDWEHHPPQVRVVAANGAEEVEATPFARNDLFVAEVEHFLACVRGEARPRVGLREGAASVTIALAARQALETGQPVVLAS
jgi:predicted dehydrogenase